MDRVPDTSENPVRDSSAEPQPGGGRAGFVAEIPAMSGESDVESDQGTGDEDFGSYRFSRKLSILSDPTGVQSSAVGALRNHLSEQHIRTGRRALAVCSVGDDVDRSLITANLAVAVAQAGASTMIVDANFRDPQLGRYFLDPEPTNGLAQYLDGTVEDPAEIVRTDVLPGLSLIQTGGFVTDPQAALASGRFEKLITGLMRNFDFTIVDCPAANTSSDIRRIASVVRYALIIAKRDVTYVDDVKRLIDELASDRVSVVGTFLNVG